MKIAKNMMKTFSTDVKISPDDERTVVARITSSVVDRAGDVVLAPGVNLKDYEANPIILLGHDYYSLPVGKVVGIKRTDEEIIAKIEFAERPEDHPEGEEWVPSTIFNLYKQGVMNAFSIGFVPTDSRAASARDITKYGEDCVQVINRSKLLEISCVPIPCHQEAVALAVSKGYVSQATADKLFKGGKPTDKMVRGDAPVDEDDEVLDAKAIAKGLRKAADDAEPLATTYTQYTRHGNTYEPAGDIKLEDKLGKYAYRVVSTWGGVGFQRMKPQTDELYKFDNSIMTDVLGEIDRFWDLKADYDKLGLMHNRGMLMYGPPGMGKSSIINQVSDMIVARGDVCLYAKNIGVLVEGLNAFREVEPDRKAVVVLEDADEYVGYQEREFLQLLDGEKSVSGVLYLATTNYLTRFPARLLRPGRFDKQVFVGAPPYEGRLAYLTNKLKESENAKEIERLAKETDGMSFGHLRELITAVYALKEPVAEVLKRLKATLKQRDYEKELDGIKAKMLNDVGQKGAEAEDKAFADITDAAPTVKEITREIATAKRVARQVDVAAPDAPPQVKHVHRFIEPPTPDVAVKTHKVVVRTLSKLRGRVWVDED